MTISAIKVRKPAIITTSNRVTSLRKRRRLAGSGGIWGVSVMAESNEEVFELTLSEAPAPRLDKALAEVAPEGVGLSRSRLVKLIDAGAVTSAAGGAVTVKRQGKAGEVFSVRLGKPVDYERAEPEDIPLEIVFQDEHLLVVNKPAGMVVHPAPGSETGTLVNALLFHVTDLAGVGGEGRPGIVHRIDKDTSGLLVVAKTDAAHQGLAAQFADHSITRRYLAICLGVPDKANPRLSGLSGVGFEDGGVLRIATNIARHKTDRKRMAVTAHEGRHAITRAKVLRRFGSVDKPMAGLVECWLETGRTHQIRVHFSHIGHALLGDPVYCKRGKLALSAFEDDAQVILSKFSRQALHAAELGFIHPIHGNELRFSSDLPQDFNEILEILSHKLREDNA